MDHMSPDDLRDRFSHAMSRMFREEVPAYGTLCDLVRDVNGEVLDTDADLRETLEMTGGLGRVSDERHGAIRLGTPRELTTVRRAFAIMGMHPVGYYDLAEAAIPVHATAFRPLDHGALSANPFRVFCSLLRLDLIKDDDLRGKAREILADREIFTDKALELIGRAEADGGLGAEDAETFVSELLETFRWHGQASVEKSLFDELLGEHRLIADVVSFRGPHINHLTPRTLDIDAVQVRMPQKGIVPKAIIEGPPRRDCPILLRQTSFKALSEAVSFRDAAGAWVEGTHTVRFGEIEQRGAALTPAGRALYDRLLAATRERIRPDPSGANAEAYAAALGEVFAEFPDDWAEMRRRGLAYFHYQPSGGGGSVAPGESLEDAVGRGAIVFSPIIYEDFLPVSAAGIFQSNLGDEQGGKLTATDERRAFEAHLGAPVADEFAHYAAIEARSKARCVARVETT